MEDFFDEELPSFLYTFIVGGPTFSTEVQTSNSKREVRFANHITPINRYKVANCKLTSTQVGELQNFFCKVQGKKYAFILRDPNEHKAENQPLLLLDAQNLKFQLIKSYDKALQHTCNAPHRKILKPIKDSVRIFTNDKKERVVKNISDELGIVTVTEEVLRENIGLLRADFDFNIPVRFDTDSLKYKSELDFCASVEPFDLVEVLK